MLLQAPDLRVQPLQSAGVFSLEEQQVLLGALELVLQVGGCHPDTQFCWQETQNCGLRSADPLCSEDLQPGSAHQLNSVINESIPDRAKATKGSRLLQFKVLIKFIESLIRR